MHLSKFIKLYMFIISNFLDINYNLDKAVFNKNKPWRVWIRWIKICLQSPEIPNQELTLNKKSGKLRTIKRNKCGNLVIKARYGLKILGESTKFWSQIRNLQTKTWAWLWPPLHLVQVWVWHPHKCLPVWKNIMAGVVRSNILKDHKVVMSFHKSVFCLVASLFLFVFMPSCLCVPVLFIFWSFSDLCILPLKLFSPFHDLPNWSSSEAMQFFHYSLNRISFCP